MNCKQVSALLEEYCHNRLTKEQICALEAHIESCESCRQSVQAYRFFLTDAQIEHDFSPPSDLNAKIKYTISQAKKEVKIPFWRNKQTLAYITAVSFACVLGFWGSSHYAKMKQALTENPLPHTQMQPDALPESAVTVSPQSEQITLPEKSMNIPEKSEATNHLENVKQSEAVSAPKRKTVPEIASAPSLTPSAPVKEETPQTAPQTDLADTPSPASNKTNANTYAEVQTEALMPASLSDTEEIPASGGGGGSNSEIQTEKASTMLRNVPATASDILPEADLEIPIEFEEQLLKKYPNHYLSEHLYSVEITKPELEAELSQTLSLENSEKTTLILFFCNAE